MFKLGRGIFGHVAGARNASRSIAQLSNGNGPFGRRHSAMIAPQTWRRSGPIMNLHDRLGTAVEGARREKPRTSRIGITFWHRPYRTAV